MISDISLVLTNLKTDFRFKEDLTPSPSTTFISVIFNICLFFPLTQYHGHIAWSIFSFTCYLSTLRTSISKITINCPNFLSLPQTSYKPQYCKRCRNTLHLCTNISLTKRSVLQNSFHLTLILVHILIYLLIPLNHIFLFSSRNHHWTAYTYFSPIDSSKSLVVKEGENNFLKYN